MLEISLVSKGANDGVILQALVATPTSRGHMKSREPSTARILEMNVGNIHSENQRRKVFMPRSQREGIPWPASFLNGVNDSFLVT